MKKKLAGVILSMLMVLTACGTPSSSVSSSSEENKPGDAVSSGNMLTDDNSAAGSGETDKLIKEITGDTAEAQGVCGPDLNWYYKDNVLVIKGTGAITEYSSSDVPWNDYRDEINRVIIDEGCTALCNGLFQGYKYLSSVILPDSLTEMGEYAFSSCDELVSVHLGSGITSTGVRTFDGCDKLKAIKLPQGLTVIGDGTFSDCKNLADIEIPAGTAEIGNSAFSGCYCLESITIPENITIIGNGAFSSCTNLTSLSIPDSVTKIGSTAFAGCDSLTALTIPKNVTELGGGVYNGCNNLKTINIQTPAYIIENNLLFNKEKTILLGGFISGTDTYTVPDGIVEVASSAFSGWDDVTSVVFPASVKKVYSSVMTDDGRKYTLTFLGDEPEGAFDSIMRCIQQKITLTIYYSGSGFDMVRADSEGLDYITWIKQ